MIRPLNDRLLVERFDDKDEKSDSGIILISNIPKKEKPQTGTVVAVGEGALENGSRVPLTCKIGDDILFSMHAGVDITLGKKEYTLMKEEGVLGIITKRKGKKKLTEEERNAIGGGFDGLAKQATYKKVKHIPTKVHVKFVDGETVETPV